MKNSTLTKRDQVYLQVVDDVLEDREAGSFSLSAILFAMTADGMSFENAVQDFGCVMFGEDKWETAYELIDSLYLTRGIEDEPKAWFEELAEEVKHYADRILARQRN